MMRQIKSSISSLMAAFGLLFSVEVLADHGQAQFFDRMDIVVIVDESGSLLHTDPDQMRFDALEMLKSFRGGVTGRVFRGCLIGFSAQVKFYTPTAKGRGTFAPWAELAEKIPELRNAKLGKFTDIKKSLEAAYEAFKSRKRRYPAYVILFTDGRPEPEVSLDADQEAAMKDYMSDLYAVVDRYRESGLRICSVAFSDKVDKTFLETIAERTNGRVFGAKAREDITPAILDFFHLIQTEQTETMKDWDLNAEVYEKEIEVSPGTVELRVEMFKTKPIDNAPEIILLSPKDRITPDMINTRTAAVAWVSNPAPAGRWKVRISGKDIGRVNIKVSQLPGFKLQVVTPTEGSEYKYHVPVSVKLHKLVPEVSTAGANVVARIKWLDGKLAGKWDNDVELNPKTGERHEWFSDYKIKQRGTHIAFFDVKIGKVDFSSGERVAFQGLPLPVVRIRDLGPAVPAEIKTTEKAKQSFQIQAENLFEEIYYSAVQVPGTSPAGLKVALFEKCSLRPNEEGKATADFDVEISSHMPLPGEKKSVLVRLIPDGKLEEPIRNALTLNFQVGPIAGKPVVQLAKIEKEEIYLGQSVTLSAVANQQTNLPEKVKVLCTGPEGQTRAMELNLAENGRYSSVFKAGEVTQLGEWVFALDPDSDGFEKAGPDVTVSARDAEFAVSAENGKIRGRGEDGAVSVQTKVNAENLYMPRDVRFEIPDDRIQVYDVPSTIVLEPSQPSQEVAVLLGTNGEKLPPWRGGWNVPLNVLDAETGRKLASYEFTVKGPAPPLFYGIVVLLALVAVVLLFFALRPNFERRVRLEIMTPAGRVQDEYLLRNLVGFFKRSVKVGSRKDDIDLEEEASVLKLTPHFGGRVSLTPLQKDKVQWPDEEEYIEKTIPLQQDRVVLVGRKRIRLTQQ